jgi:aminocarboxymuconate-semialdehyde decarboxylase
LQKAPPRKPSAYLKKVYCDSIVQSVTSLQYLVQVVGADRVVVGTDYPMAMGDFESVAKVMRLDLSVAQRELILGGNAKKALPL